MKALLRNYEMVYIVKPDLEEEQVNEVVEKFSALISKDGGEVVAVDNWGKEDWLTKLKTFVRAIIFSLILRVCRLQLVS